MSRKVKRGGIIGGLLLGTAALVPGLAFAAGTGPTSTPPAQTQAQPAPSTIQQSAMAPEKTMGANKPMAARETMRGERKEVTTVQQALNQRGSNLKVDGKLGAKTSEALKAFQQKNGLTPTGRLDKATEAALKVT